MSADRKPVGGDQAPASDHDYREFVVAFTDALARLGHLLTVGWPRAVAANQLAVGALAQVRRQWRDIDATGAPEPLAVEELLSKLPRRHNAPSAAVVDVAPPEPDPEPERELDADEVRDAVWSAFTQLPPRWRVPLVFVDASTASPRLAGFDVPASYASPHRLASTFDVALLSIRESLRRNARTTRLADSFTDGHLVEVLVGALRSHAADYPMPIDPYPQVVSSGRRLRRRTQLIGTIAVVAVVALGATMVALSSKNTGRTTAALHVRNDPETAGSGDGILGPGAGASPTPAGSISNQGPSAPAARPTDPVLVVPWSPRGNAVNDAILLAHLELYFTTVHGDATGQTQVLLATDTPTLRIAYVTSNSRNGVIASWFYGPVGSDDLVEGATSYGGSLLPDSILADGLIDSSGHEQLVVIAPPATTGMQIADFDFDDPSVAQGFAPLPYQNGIAVKDMKAGASASSFVVDVSVGTATFTIKDAPDLHLGPQFSGSVTSDGPPAAAPLPTPSVQRGHPDPTLVTEALQVAAVWEKSSPSVAAHPVVLWGGTDTAGTKLVVLRVKTATIDLLVLEWTGDAPGLHGELLIHPTTPEVPVAFSYRALDGVRVGVIGSPGAVRAVLDYNGTTSAPVTLDATGFASFRITNPSPPPSNDAASDLDFTASVQLLDASGRVIATAPEPPSV